RFGVDEVLAGVHEHERAGAVGGLGLAHLVAGLPEQGGLLVPERGGDGHAAEHPPEGAAGDLAVDLRGGADLGEDLHGDADGGGDVLVPAQVAEVHHQGAGGVGDVGDVHAAVDAAGEIGRAHV